MKKHLNWKLVAILVATLFFGFFDLPKNIQQKIVPFTPQSILKAKINLGLDLQGGSQLDYKIALRDVPEKDRKSIIEGVQNVINNRVNALGVSEPNIYNSTISDEAHIIVELANNATIEQTDVDKFLEKDKVLANLTDDEKKKVSLEKAKEAVGKTIQLEFKEQKKELDPQEKDKIKERAQSSLDKIKGGADFSVVAQEESQSAADKIKYDKPDYTFESDLPSYSKDVLGNMKIGDISKKLIESSGTFALSSSGQAVQDTSLAIIKLVDTKEEVKDQKQADVSRILIAYKGAEKANSTVTRNEDEAYKLAKEIKDKLGKGEKFDDLAKKYSDDTNTAANGGKLDNPITGNGTQPYDFEKAALALAKDGDISDIVKTQNGYNIIRADSVQSNVKQKKYKYEMLSYSTKPDEWKDTGLNGKHFVHADVQVDSFFQPYVNIQFDAEGGKMFEDLTARHVGDPIAIFVGGQLISSPRVNEKIAGGKAQITGTFTNEEAKNLARDLNTGAIPAPIVLTGEYTLGASLGHEALNQSLLAGLIGVLLVIVFMIVMYRLPGLVASGALILYGTLLIFLIKAHLSLAWALLFSLLVFGFIVWKIINNKEAGWEKLISFILSCFGFFFLTFLIQNGVVMTLAGMAGLIMSFGIAVDANVLIFERLKEEIKEGKTYTAALDAAFHRAWTAIRDSNFSTLFTCAILFYFGSSIIRGFAFNLAAGILVSMFTAIAVTKTMLSAFAGKSVTDNLKLFGITEKKESKHFEFIKSSKIWLAISGTLVGLSIIGFLTLGLNLGIDFQGGSLMQFKFNEPIAKEKIAEALKEAGKTVNAAPQTATTPPSTPVAPSKTTDKSLQAAEETKLNFSTINVIESSNNSYIIKTNYITSANHEKLLTELQNKLPKFSESRFTSIGPVVGQTLFNKAIFAILLAVILIVLYLSFAFRKVPKSVNPWRFGTCAIIAMIHDISITTGIFVFLGKFMGVEIDALFITAMLTVFGYSVNDTIVVYDRIREKLLNESDGSFEDVANKALNETFVRSINTSLTAVLALLAVLVLGNSAIFYFVLALTIGIIVGTYSSIFVATPLLVYWNKKVKRE
ncbi:protein translocase subunit SecF [Candidatus Peregrinibacteria bacterium]|nr:protein translocase subunit SecF [Candidatus Peregrinibacteria bacterium]